MRIPCPVCGARDLREFTVQGAALDRPEDGEWGADWDDYLHNRANPAGESSELWYHGQGCGAWLIVTRNTLSHAVIAARLARGEAGA